MDTNIRIATRLVKIAKELLAVAIPPGYGQLPMDRTYICQNATTHRNVIKIKMSSQWDDKAKMWKIERVLRGNNKWIEGCTIEPYNNGFVVKSSRRRHPVYNIVPFVK